MQVKIKRKIEIEFEEDFILPGKFDGVEAAGMKGKCEKSPFYAHDTYEAIEYCIITQESD